MARPSDRGSETVEGGPPIAAWLEALGLTGPFQQREPNAGGGSSSPLLTAAETLLALLRDTDPDVRVRAVAALGNLGGQAHHVLPRIHAALKAVAFGDDDATVRGSALHAVLQVGPQSTSEVATLIDNLRDELAAVRFHAAVALGEMGREARPAVAALTHACLWDEDPAVRVESAAALWKIDRKTAPVVQSLVKALNEDNELICWIAADCLGLIGPDAREAAPALRQALDRDFKVGLVRRGVALALERVETPADATTEGA